MTRLIDWLAGDPTRDSLSDPVTTPGLSGLEHAARQADRDFFATMDAAHTPLWDESDLELDDEQMLDDAGDYAYAPVDEGDDDPATGTSEFMLAYGDSLDFEGWYGFHTFTPR